MNEHMIRKDGRMTVEEAVELGATTFANAETAAKEIRKTFRDLKPVFETIRDAGHIGGLESLALTTRCDALATQFVADLYDLHAELTEKAKAAGIDLPVIASGGR